jgi:poly-gamma-glutamate synthesis protein (capsule biosynthesis protein)
MSATIGLLGDVMLGRMVADRLAQGAPERVFSDELARLCGSCDALLCNLECCISARGAPTSRIPAKPFFFRAPPTAVESLRAVGASAVSLANNHALDFEDAALVDTLEHLASRPRARVPRSSGPGEASSCKRATCGSVSWPRPTTRRSTRPRATRQASRSPTSGAGFRAGSGASSPGSERTPTSSWPSCTGGPT